MNRVIKSFLEISSEIEVLREPFDYDFNQKSSIKSFKIEYKKFMWIYSNFYFKNGRLKMIYNDYDIKISDTDLIQIFELYRYTCVNELIEKYILGEFLMAYYNSINDAVYKSNGPGKEPVAEYRKIQKGYEKSENIYTELQGVAYEFYCMLISYILEKDEYLYEEIIDRMKVNVKSIEKYNKLVSKLLKSEKNISRLIEKDNEITKHAEIYNNYIRKGIKEFNLYKYPSKMIRILDKEKKLDEKTFDLVVNDIVDKVNDMHDKLKNNLIDLIRDIASIDELLNEMNSFINNLKTITLEQREKLKECRINVMTIKRYLLSDETKIKDSLQEFSFETKIETKEIDKVVDSISNNVLKLYANSKVDFEAELIEALKSYSDHPLIDLTSSFTLDSTHQVYYVFRKEEVSSFFNEYYDSIGREYTVSHKNELTNKLTNGYYNQLLKYLKRTFPFHQMLLIDFLKSRNKFNDVIEKLKEIFGIITDNEYSIVAHNVIEIEARIVDILKQRGLNIDKNPEKNIVELAKYYKNNKIAFNGLTYINYILYEESGLKIRNNIAHGNLIGQNLDAELITTFSSIILLQWLYNEK